MFAHKLAVGGITAGLILGGWGVATRDGGGSDPAVADPIATIGVLEPDHGLVPIDEVVSLWRERADARPLDYLSRTQLGMALTSRARERADLTGYEDAEAELRDALAVNPQYTSAQLALASALVAQHEFADARSLAESIHEQDGSPGALALVGDTSLELGDYERAAMVYDDLAATERSAPILSRLARLHSVQGDPDSAVRLSTEALAASRSLALRPSGAAFYHFQLGHFLFAAGDTDGAIAALEDARTVHPGNPGASEELAFVYASVGRTADAAELYEQLLARGPAADLHGLYADLLDTTGDTAGAAEQERLGAALAAETIDRFPAERRHLAGYFATRDPATAVALAEADVSARHDVGAYDALAWALHNDGQHEAAADAATAALAQGTRDASFLYHAAAIAAATGDVETARSQLLEVQEINPMFHPTEGPAAAALLDELS